MLGAFRALSRKGRAETLALTRQVRFALRRLRRTPVYTIGVVCILAVGIGVGTASFSIVNGLMFRRSNQISGVVHFARTSWAQDFPGILSADAVRSVLDDPPPSLAWVIGSGSDRVADIRASGVPMKVHVQGVAGPYFQMLGGRPLYGRLLSAADSAEAVDAAVVSEHFWRTRLGADPTAVGTTLYASGRALAIVGVVADPFTGTSPVIPAEVWVPAHVVAVVEMLGRLGPGVSLAQAAADVRSRYLLLPTAREASRTLEVRDGLGPGLPAWAFIPVTGVLALTDLLLLIGAASVSMMLLARLKASQGEMAVRVMLGATRRHLMQPWMFELGLLGLAATSFGLLIAAWLSRVVVAAGVQLGAPLGTLATTPDWRVTLYAGGLMMLTLFGLLGLVGRQLATLPDLVSTAGASGAGASTPQDTGRRTALVTVQVAIATGLLLLAAFLVRGVTARVDGQLGFDASHVVAAPLSSQQVERDPERTSANAKRALMAARDVSGVSAAALTTGVIPAGGMSVRGHALDSPWPIWVTVRGVTAEFFDVVPLALRRGRLLTPADDRDAAPVAAVSEGTARRLWPGRDPVGQSLWMTGIGGRQVEVTIVGVLADSRLGLERRRDSEAFVPYAFAQLSLLRGSTALLVAGPIPADQLAERIRTDLARQEPQVTFEFVSPWLLAMRGGRETVVLAQGVVVLGTVGLVMAMSGLYGLTAFLATQRHREFGVRKALGASGFALFRMIFLEGLPPIVRGEVIGVAVAMLTGLWLKARQFPALDVLDPFALSTITMALLAAGTLGSVLPFAQLIRREASAMLRDS